MSTYNINNLFALFGKSDLVSRDFKAGDFVFRDNTEVSHIYFVRSGEIRVQRNLSNGQELVFFRVKEGSAVDEMALFLTKHPYTAVASVDSTLLLAQKPRMLELLRSKPTFMEQFFGCLASRYTESLMLRELASLRSADDRILMWLEWRAIMGERELDLAGRMGGLGAELGLTRESVYRSLARLEKRRLIKRKDGVLQVLQR